MLNNVLVHPTVAHDIRRGIELEKRTGRRIDINPRGLMVLANKERATEQTMRRVIANMAACITDEYPKGAA